MRVPRFSRERDGPLTLFVVSTATKIWALIGGLASVGMLVWLGVSGIATHTPVAPLAWPLLALAYVLADRLHARFEVGGEAHMVNVADALLVVGLAYLPPHQLLMAWAVGEALGSGIWHRKSLQKGLFNLFNRVLECGIAAGMYSLVLGPASPVSAVGWIAALVAVLAASLVSYLAVTAAISLSTGRLTASLRDFAVQMTIMSFNVLVGLIATNVIWVDARGVWMLVVSLALTSIGFRVFVRTRQRLASLTSMERFASHLAGETDSSVVVERALNKVAELLHAGEALLIRRVTDGVREQRLSNDGTVRTEIYHADDVPPSLSSLLAFGSGVLVSAGEPAASETTLADALGWTSLIAVPMPIEGSPGVIVAGNRLGEQEAFDATDLQLLETFALSTSVALRVCELVDQLRSQALEKEHLARHDALTKLPNRMVADERLRQLLPLATPESMVGVMFIDLDRFKEVNDALGHHIGDELLREIGSRLRQVVGRRGTVARLGGDEFAIIIPNVAEVDEMTALATVLRTTVAEPVMIDRLSLNALASVGIALAPHDGNDARSLFRRADVAMYAAKNRRTGFEYYDPQFDQSSTRTLSLTADLRAALDDQQLLLHYQPQVSLNGQIIGIEALARWPHPRYGSVPPDEFIAVAEQHGLIHLITRWAISTSLADLREMRKIHPDLRVSVNMSARDLMDLNFPGDVERMLNEAGLPPSALALELTESQILSDRRRSIDMLGRLRALGVRLAIDDFGTGHSSLAYLNSLPVHEVKIDRSFVLAMAANNDDAVIVRSIIDMAHNLGLEAVAEGVEDADAWRILADRGCDLAQGYLMAPGLPLQDLVRWLVINKHGVHPAGTALSMSDDKRASVVRLVPRAS